MNMMKYCPECYKELPPNSAVCPFCGYRTGNGDDEIPAGILQTPLIDSYIPPEQTVLGLLLLIIFFWGISLAGAAMPFFFEMGSKRNVLIAVIASQLLVRILIGFWATEEVSLKKDASAGAKAGAFFLALIPIGDIYSSLHAARTTIRKERLPVLATASISAVVIMSLVLYRTSEQVTNLLNSGEFSALAPTPTPEAVATEAEAEPESKTPTPIPTPTLQAYFNGCRNPLAITADEEDDYVQVCGEITNFGVIECDSCPLGFYSFVKLEGGFQVVSYEWFFTHAFLRKCVKIEDNVEMLGDKPAFVFSKAEGCIGDECETDFHNGLIDDGGIYFQPFEGCD